MASYIRVRDENGNVICIPLIRGKDGKTPERGKDFMTPEDIALITNNVLQNFLDLAEVEL